ncbi:hypothetical protein TrVE_jg13879 [Triparma verrucosa]|uniref:Uncharacterized protein n=1 Tax=Triparma verrucosa TaxID=1606542 RepID=A0A9W7BQJ9_9STRA|nr:hypothetical protein TrVE_jg13879 [Triparma verrucosa]
MSLSTAQPNAKHPVSVDEKHSSFMAKARRLNRTKVFQVENKRSMAASVAREDFIDVLKKDEKLRGLDDSEERERRKEELKSKFEEGKRRYHPPGPKAGMSSREASEYKRRAALALALRPPKQSTPIDNITTQARQSMTNFDSYDSHLNSYEKVKQFRSSMDSRAKGMVGEVTGGRFEGVINADGWDSDGAEGFGFGSGEDGAYDGGGGGQYSGYHEHREHREHQGHFEHREHREHREPRSHLKELNDALGFDQSVPVANPSMGELSGTFKLFGLESEEEVDEEMRRRGQPQRKKDPKYGHSKRQYEHEHYGSDDQYYNALNPLPINYTNDHRMKPKIQKNHKDDYDERQAIALSDSVIKEVRAKYSVTAVRALYRRRRETEESDQKLEYNRNKKMMQADERVKEWKRTRVDQVRKKKTGSLEDLNKEVVKKVAVEKEEPEEFYIIEGLTLKEMSTDPFYKSNKEMDARKALKANRKVMLKSRVDDNGGYMQDAKLCLQMLATALLRDIDGGIIPRAKEKVVEGLVTGDLEMILEPKPEKDYNRQSLKNFEIRMPRHNFDDDKERARLTTAPV